jgi:hypothetical protein
MIGVCERFIQEKTRAAAAPMKPKKGAISSPLKTVDIFQTDCQMSKQIEFSLKTCKISTCPVSKISAQRYHGRPSTRDQNQTTA